MTSSAINSALSTSSALMAKLTAVNAASASSKNSSTLTLINNMISNQLNQKVTALQDQVQTSTVGVLQQQQTGLNTQLQSYQTAEGQISANGSVLADLSLQLANMATAAQSGNSTTFDQTLTAAQLDVADLQTVSFAPGLLPDGTAALMGAGLNIQSASTYNLSTPTGQAQALSAAQAAETQVQQISTMNNLNQQITASAQTALQTQISGIGTQINNLQIAQQTAIAQQTTTLEQQAQEEYHIIEMNLGNATNASSFLTSVEGYQRLAAVQPGTTLGLLGGNAGQPALFTANLTTSTPSSSGSYNPRIGTLLSTNA